MRMWMTRLAALALALCGLPVAAQPPAAPAAGAAEAPSRAPATESWFKIMHQTRHIGHARLLVSRVSEQGVPAVHLLLEASHLHPETGLPSSTRVDALLQTTDLSILDYQFTADVTLPSPLGRLELFVTCQRKERGKWTFVHQGPSGRFSPEEIVSDVPLTIEEAFFFLVASREDLRRNGGPLRARVFNPIQFDKSQLDIDLEVLPPEKRPYVGQDLLVSPYRWRRPGLMPQSTLTATEYVSEAGVLQESAQLLSGDVVPLVLIRTATEEESLPEGRRLVKRRGRRDPFDVAKVLTPKDDAAASTKPKGTPDQAPAQTPAEALAKALAEANRLVTAAEGQHREYGKLAEEKIKGLYNQFLDIVLKLAKNEAMTDAQRVDLEQMRTRFEQIYPGALAIIEQGKKMLVEARQALESMSRLPVSQQNYEAIDKMLKDIKDLEASRELSASRNSPYVTTFKNEILKPVETLEKRMVARQQFQKIKIEITGIIYHLVETPWPVAAGARVLGQDLRVTGAIPLFASRSGAIVNGAPLLEGDILDLKGLPAPDLKPEDGVLVLRIRTDEVVFRYKDEEIPVPIKEPLQEPSKQQGTEKK